MAGRTRLARFRTAVFSPVAVFGALIVLASVWYSAAPLDIPAGQLYWQGLNRDKISLGV